MMSNTTTTTNNNDNNCNDNLQKHYYEQRLSLAVCLTLGGQLLSKNNFEEATDAFESAYRFLTLTPSVAMPTSGNFVKRKTKQEMCVQHDNDDIISSSLPSSSSSSSSVSTTTTSSITQEQQHIDTYHEDECDVGPRTFNEAIVPDDVMGLDIDVLHLIISYNQALVFHRSKNYVLASQLYKFITSTIATYLSATGTTHATLSHLAMRAHNNLGQIEYTERSEECAHSEFDNALAYVRGHHHQHQQAPAPIISVAAVVIANTTTPEHQLEIASVLSNWCRTRWMLGRVDENVYTALEDILRIRSSHMDENHPDIAVAHFNLGRAEFSRQSNTKALKHFLHYMRISSHRFQEKNSSNIKNVTTNNNIEEGVGNIEVDFELDPIQGLIYVLQIQNDEKDDEMSQDLIWGLRTLQEKRTELGSIHTEVASVLNYIGTLLFRRRELDYALCFFAQELRVEERLRVQAGGKNLLSSSSPSSPNDDVSISVTCNNIGRILQELGRYPEAKYYYQRSLGNSGGDDDNNNSDTSAKNCTIRGGSSKYSSKTVSKNVVNEDGSDNDNTSDVPSAAMNLYSTVWYNLGLIHDKMGAFKEAIRAFRMSLKLRRAMLGHEHSDVSCLLYNIGVLQMEQNFLEEASESFREALAHRHVAGKGQLNDHHVIKTLQKLSSLLKSKGNLNGALQANRDILSVLTTSTDFKYATRNRKIAIVMRNIADLYQAQGNLQVALEHATNSANLFRLLRTTPVEDQKMEDDMDVDNTEEEEEDDDDEKDNNSFIEEETNALLLVGSLQHEQCDPLSAHVAFSETVRLVHFTLSTSAKFASTLLPLLEVSAMLASAHCAAEA
jgi:tetratricopeptide (TPR) repeat protein